MDSFSNPSSSRQTPMHQLDFLRVSVAVFDLAGAAMFALVAALLFFVASDSEGNFQGSSTILIVIAMMALAVLGVVLSLFISCKRPSRAWLTWNIAYLVLSELPVVTLLNFSEAKLKVWFPVLIVPVVGCVACWRLTVLQKRQEQEAEALQTACVDEASTSDASYSSSSELDP